MTKTRLELIEMVSFLETKRVNITNLKSTVGSRFTENIRFSCTIDGKDYSNKYNGEYIKINEKFFIEYLDKELTWLDHEINQLIKDMMKGGVE